MRIEVTLEDIQKGHHGQCSTCPIALAVNRTYGQAHGAKVRTRDVWPLGWTQSGYRLPEKARDFIRAFDAGHDCAPFDFELTEEIKPWIVGL